MIRQLSPRLREYLVFAFVGFFALLSLLRLVERGPVPWIPIVGVSVVATVFTGPVVWLARDRVSEQRREDLTLGAFGIAMVLIPILFGLSLAFGVPPLLPSFDVLIVGVYVGFLLSFIAERTIVPERLRAVR